MAAPSIVHSDVAFPEFYGRLAAGKPKKVALMTCICQLARVRRAMLADETLCRIRGGLRLA